MKPAPAMGPATNPSSPEEADDGVRDESQGLVNHKHNSTWSTEQHPNRPSPARDLEDTRERPPNSSNLDIELANMRQEDPLYSNGTPDLHKRSPWTTLKDSDMVGGTLDDQRLNDTFDRERLARRLGNKHFLHKLFINGTLIALWYTLSIAMSVYNKWMFSPGNLDFHFPLFSTSVHMVVQFILASLVLWIFPQFRPSRGTLTHEYDDPEQAPPPESNVTRDPSKPIMTPWFYLTRIVSCGTVTGLDIGLGNTSLKFISLTFFTMVKSSTLGFVLAFAIIFRLEAPSWKIGAIIAVMTIGVILMVSGETAFDALGFALLLLASFFSGLRWSLTQILLRRTAATSNPFSTLFFLTPVMFAVLFLIAVPSETFPALFEGLDILAAQQGLPLGLAIVLFPGAIAFCMTAAEFTLLKRTSVVTLSVCGIFKEVLTITAAGIIFGDELTPINISGLVIALAAIAVYNYTRMRRMKSHEISKVRDDKGPSSGLGNSNASQSAPNISSNNLSAEQPLRASQDPFTIDDDGEDDPIPPTSAPIDPDDEHAPMLRSAARPHLDTDADRDQEDLDDILHDPRGSTADPSTPLSAHPGRRRDGYEAL